jgi:hypothetical protein
MFSCHLQHFFRSLQFPYIHNALFTLKISNFPQFTPLEHLQWEQFQYKIVSAERLHVSTCFVTHYYCHLLVNRPTKANMYSALQNKNGVYCWTIIIYKRQLTMSYGGRNRKWHSLQAGICKNCDEYCKMILYCSTFSCFNNFIMRLLLSILNIKIISLYKYMKIKWYWIL